MKKNRIIVATLIVVTFVFICIRGGKIPFALFWMTIIVPLFSVIYTIIMYSKLRFSHKVDKREVVKGENVKYSCVFCNESAMFHPYVSVEFFNGMEILNENKRIQKSFSLLPYGRKVIDFDMQCKFKGIFEFGVKSINVEDFLGIISLKFTIPESRTIVVYPRLIRIRKISSLTSSMSDVDSNTGQHSSSGMVMADIREYCYGDSIRRIHWKITSKLNKLMIKNFHETVGENVVLVLDLKRAYSSAYNNFICEDLLIESVLAVSHYYLANCGQIKLLTLGTSAPELSANNLHVYKKIYTFLSNVLFTVHYDVTLAIKLYLRNQINKTNIVLFISDLSLDIYNQIHEIKKIGCQISLVLISPVDMDSNSDKYIKSITKLLEIGVVVYNIKSSECIEKEFECKKIA